MISRPLALPFVLGFLASFAACDDDGVGAPCSKDSDCASGLVCDEHDGQASCQMDHGHGTEDEDTEHEDTEHAETEHADETGSTGHESGGTGHATGTGT